MASLPYPLCHDCTANLVGMARMPYPPTICKDNSELLLNMSAFDVRCEEIIYYGEGVVFNKWREE